MTSTGTCVTTVTNVSVLCVWFHDLQLENERLTSEVEELTRRMATLSPPPPPPQDDTAAPALEAQVGQQDSHYYRVNTRRA